MTSALACSVVIPCFNHGDYLEQAIGSVFGQAIPVEIIVIDDGSTDNSAEILRQSKMKFYWETRTNAGQSATLNYGWSIAHGQVLGYLSADDLLKPEACACAMKIFKAHPEVVVVYCDFETIDPSGAPIRRVRTADFSLRRMLTEFECPPGPGAFFRRSAFEAVGGWDVTLKRIPDFEFWLRMALQGQFVRIPRVLAQWRIHEGSQAFSAIPADRADEPQRVIKTFFTQNNLPSEIQPLASSAMGMSLLISAQLHARSNRWLLAVSRLFAACRQRPTLLLKISTWRIIANALLQQRLQRLLWAVRQIFKNYLLRRHP